MLKTNCVSKPIYSLALFSPLPMVFAKLTSALTKLPIISDQQ